MILIMRLEIANNTEYGLTGAVISNNRKHIERASEDFHVGNLYFNELVQERLLDISHLVVLICLGQIQKQEDRIICFCICKQKQLRKCINRTIFLKITPLDMMRWGIFFIKVCQRLINWKKPALFRPANFNFASKNRPSCFVLSSRTVENRFVCVGLCLDFTGFRAVYDRFRQTCRKYFLKNLNKRGFIFKKPVI